MIRNPEKGYRGRFLWLPKKYVHNLRGIKATLTFPLTPGTEPICAWSEDEHHLCVPREYVTRQEYKDFPFEIIENRYTFPKISGVHIQHDFRTETQRQGCDALKKAENGILALGCGKGKTYCLLRTWAEYETPALIVTNTKDVMYQWALEAIPKHTNLRQDEIGIIGDGTFVWEDRPITVALVHTLARHALAGTLPKEFQQYFGVCAYDECHFLGAPYFQATAALCLGHRFGLSATHRREDGLDALYKYHIGDVVYEDLTQDLIPHTVFIRTGVRISPATTMDLSVGGQLSYQKVSSWLGRHEVRNRIVQAVLKDLLDGGRITLALSHVIENLEILHARFPETGLVTGDVTGKKRGPAFHNHPLVFATTQLAKQALDREELDALCLILPFRQQGMFQQAYGRIQRSYPGKQSPMVVIFEDEHVEMMARHCNALRTWMTQVNYPFEIIEAQL